ncbi:MAG: hypothetical protein ACRBI6_17695 [Acidimicrobiales bacterium]
MGTAASETVLDHAELPLDATFVAYLPSTPAPESVVAFIEEAANHMCTPLDHFEFWGDVSRPRRGRWDPERATTLLRDGDRGEPPSCLSVTTHVRGGDNRHPASSVMVQDLDWWDACASPCTRIQLATRVRTEAAAIPLAQAWAKAAATHLGTLYGLGYAAVSKNWDFDYASWWINGTIYERPSGLGECEPVVEEWERVRNGQRDLTPVFAGELCRSVRAVNVLRPALAELVRPVLAAEGVEFADQIVPLGADHVMWTVADDEDQRRAQKALYDAGLCVEREWLPLARHVVLTEPTG